MVQERAEDEVVADLAGAEIGFDVAGGIGPGEGLAEARRQALIERLAVGKEVVELGWRAKARNARTKRVKFSSLRKAR